MKSHFYKEKIFLVYFCSGFLLGCISAPIIIDHLKLQDIFRIYAESSLSHVQISPGKIVSLRLRMPSEMKKISRLQRANVLLEVDLPSGINYVSKSATVPPTKIISNIDGKTTISWDIGIQDLTKSFYEIAFFGIIRPDATIDSISGIKCFTHFVEQQPQIYPTQTILSDGRQNCHAQRIF